jgi:DNA (cytosine-5)-methyltransferase 1
LDVLNSYEPEKTLYRLTESGFYVPDYIARKPKKPIAFDFFAGAGGFSLGFIQAGYEVIGANEFDTSAALTYMVNLGSYPINIHFVEENDKDRLNKAIMRNWGIKNTNGNGTIDPEQLPDILGSMLEWRKKLGNSQYWTKFHLPGSGWISHNPDASPVRNYWFGDVRKLKGKDILDALGLKQGDIDVVMGGPPCQGYSKLGKQNVDDPRNTLIFEYARMITELQPKTFVMEEVPDVINFFTPDGVPVLDKFCYMLEEGGYGKWEKLKDTVLRQTNAAVVIKNRGAALKMRMKTKKEKQPEAKKENDVQQELF